MPCLSIAAGCVLLAGAGVAPETVPPPAVWIDWPEDAARSDGWRAAVPAGAVEVGSAVTAVARAGRLGGMQVVVVAALRAVTVALPAGTDERLDVPAGQSDDLVELRDGQDALRVGRDARRAAPAGCREALAGQAERPAGQAARLYRDDRDVGPEGVCRADPDERRGGDPVHPDATRREAA